MQDRLFPADPEIRAIAKELYSLVSDLPIISPHGHVEPDLLLKNEPFANPAALFIYFDHYLLRMLHAQGFKLEELGRAEQSPEVAIKAWRILCGNWHIFAGTNSGYWFTSTLADLFGITDTPSAENADRLYELIDAKLKQAEFLPRQLFKRFKIEFLATTDDPIDDLSGHQQINSDPAFGAKIAPTFRPDKYLDPRHDGWVTNVRQLLNSAEVQELSYSGYIKALEKRRKYFIAHGAVSADHGVVEPYTTHLPEAVAAKYFIKAIENQLTAVEARDFAGHMLVEMARMSCEDGLVMTLHAGVFRNHHQETLQKFGPDTGHDFPIKAEFVKNLRALLNKYGNHPNFKLILFSLDESTWGREIAALASFYSSVLIGVPWWFLDSPDAILRFRSVTTEVAGFYRGSGFIDDTRAFLSIPARHDMARRVDSVYLARLVSEGRITIAEAKKIAVDLVVEIPKRAFRL